MILVEIYVPSMERKYEFRLNEDVAAGVIIEELSSVICQKEQCKVCGKVNDLMLLLPEKSRIISSGLSLYENGVKSGDRLMLI